MTTTVEKKIEIELTNGEKVTKLSMKAPSANDVITLLSSAFTFLDADLNLIKVEDTYTKLANLYANFGELHTIGEASETNEYHAVSETDLTEWMKQLDNPPTPSEKYLTSVLKVIEGEPEEERAKRLFKLGIKEKFSGTVYRMDYKCDSCNYEGRHYIHRVHSKCHCHKCDKNLDVQFANKESIEDNLLPDANNTFFIGR